MSTCEVLHICTTDSSLFDPFIHPDVLPVQTLPLFKLRHLTSTFAPSIITKATRCCLTINLSVGR